MDWCWPVTQERSRKKKQRAMMRRARGRSLVRHYGLPFLGALSLSACMFGPASNNENAVGERLKTVQEDTDNLPPFRAAGFEPPWSMTWNGSVMTVTVGFEEETTTFTDLVSQAVSGGWRLTADSGFDLVVLHEACLDLAAKAHEFDLDATIKGQRLVGCGDRAR